MDVERVETKLRSMDKVAEMAGPEIVSHLDYLRQTLAETTYELRKAKDKMNEVEADTYLRVSQKTGENGKPKYSNETLRQKATVRELSENKDYVDARAYLYLLEYLKDKITGKIATMKDALSILSDVNEGGS